MTVPLGVTQSECERALMQLHLGSPLKGHREGPTTSQLSADEGTILESRNHFGLLKSCSGRGPPVKRHRAGTNTYQCGADERTK